MLLEQITWGKADSQTPGVYNLKDCAGRCIFYLEVLNLGSLDGLQEICEPLKISAELVCICVCLHMHTGDRPESTAFFIRFEK